jgi:hypothetical protein
MIMDNLVMDLTPIAPLHPLLSADIDLARFQRASTSHVEFKLMASLIVGVTTQAASLEMAAVRV